MNLRDNHMAPEIIKMAAEGSTIMAVCGAAHLEGLLTKKSPIAG